MLSWLHANFGSIIAVLVLLAVVALIIRRLILDKRAGKHICGGSCGSCGAAAAAAPCRAAATENKTREGGPYV